jgi:hypothetical protein
MLWFPVAVFLCPSRCFSAAASQIAFIHPPLHLPVLPVFCGIHSSTQMVSITYCKLCVQSQLYNTLPDYIFTPGVNGYRIQFPSSNILAHPITSVYESGPSIYEFDRPVFNYRTYNIKKIYVYICKECDSVVQYLIITP